jgi:small multidrug resistance pump
MISGRGTIDGISARPFGTVAMNGWAWLGLAIAAEVIATSALNASAGFSRIIPAAIAVPGYVLAFYCLSMALRTIPLGLAYALWSGVGIALLALIGWLAFRQSLTAPQIAGLILILAGIMLIRLPIPR